MGVEAEGACVSVHMLLVLSDSTVEALVCLNLHFIISHCETEISCTMCKFVHSDGDICIVIFALCLFLFYCAMEVIIALRFNETLQLADMLL